MYVRIAIASLLAAGGLPSDAQVIRAANGPVKAFASDLRSFTIRGASVWLED